MRIAYLDGFSGISGDMFLGALVDAGVPFKLFQDTVAALDIGATMEASRVDRNGISATKIDVIVDGQKDMPREEFEAHIHDQPGGHVHPKTSAASHDHGGERLRKGNHPHGRSLEKILAIIAAAPIGDRAKRIAKEIFVALGTAEAKVHNVDIADVHFHEVGAVDAITDIICAAVGAEALGVKQFLCSPLNVGGGTVKCEHGVMPVPAPATLELLKGIPVYSGEVQKELVTPTGAAIVRVLSTKFGARPVMTTEQIGYGAGTRDFPQHSNVLRLAVGDTLDPGLSASETTADIREEELVVLEANLDDLSPQIIGYLVDQLLAEGVLDAFTTAVQMKKGRPGALLTVLAKPQDEQKLRAMLFRESSTLGVRSRRERRHAIARRHESVHTAWGEVRIKIGTVGGADSNYSPEYEDCRRIAMEHHVPLKSVMLESLRLYLEKKNG
jgi:pyridinium-3,5-bisthiocarboxylic acid mononucleotide nickel chelatase